MIKIVDGDLLNATENIIGHQVNCQGKMNSGVAKAIREKFPIAYGAYIAEYNVHYNKRLLNDLLGRCQLVFTGTDKIVANLFGQFNYGYDGKQYTSVYALRMSLMSLKDKAQHLNASVALPYKIGSDRGGADWNEVYKIIDEVFSDYEVTLYRLKV
jgi:O-acetyl-ADP-ribose deacetylase (regulator of RNase III)